MVRSVGVALLLVGFCALPLPATGGSRPNVVLFLVDDMGWTDWEQAGARTGSSFYETPNMNRLARAGVTFTNAYSSSPVCSPTRNALLTGKNPARTRMTQWIPGSKHASTLRDPDWDESLNAEEVTLAEALRAGGYATAFVGKWHLGPKRTSPAANPLNHGFESNVGGNHRGEPNLDSGYFADGDGSFGLPGLGAGSSVPGDYLTDRLTDFAVDFIDRSARSGKPFFLLMSHYGVHIPIRARADLVSKYEAKPRSGRHFDVTYAAMLESVDVSLGRILDELDAQGIRRETIVVFTSDNGGNPIATSNAPLRDGKGFLYEGGIRVPLIVSWKGNRRVRRGLVSKAVVVTHDIYPTLLELTGVEGDPVHNENIDGVSFRAALAGRSSDRGATFWHYPHISPQSTDAVGGRYVSAVRVGDWKLIYFYEDESWELYHLATDIREQVNLIEECSPVASELRDLLVGWLLEVDAQLPIVRATGRPVALPSRVPTLKRFPLRQWSSLWLRSSPTLEASGSLYGGWGQLFRLRKGETRSEISAAGIRARRACARYPDPRSRP